MHHVDSKNH